MTATTQAPAPVEAPPLLHVARILLATYYAINAAEGTVRLAAHMTGGSPQDRYEARTRASNKVLAAACEYEGACLGVASLGLATADALNQAVVDAVAAAGHTRPQLADPHRVEYDVATALDVCRRLGWVPARTGRPPRRFDVRLSQCQRLIVNVGTVVLLGFDAAGLPVVRTADRAAWAVAVDGEPAAVTGAVSLDPTGAR